MFSVLAGDIRVGRDVIIGTGDIVIGGVILVGWLVSLCVLIAKNRRASREDKLIQAAESVELAAGVTLLEGVRAYFGEYGRWHVNKGMVDITAGSWGHPYGNLRVHPETGKVEVFIFLREGYLENVNQPKVLIGEMVRAVRGKAILFPKSGGA